MKSLKVTNVKSRGFSSNYTNLSNSKFKINGSVIDPQHQFNVCGLIVEAWDTDPLSKILVDRCITDEHGFFCLSFDQDYYKELFVDRDINISFKIYNQRSRINAHYFISYNLNPSLTALCVEIEGNKDKGRR